MTDQLSKVFAALADPTRRDMVSRLVGSARAAKTRESWSVTEHLLQLIG